MVVMLLHAPVEASHLKIKDRQIVQSALKFSLFPFQTPFGSAPSACQRIQEGFQVNQLLLTSWPSDHQAMPTALPGLAECVSEFGLQTTSAIVIIVLLLLYQSCSTASHWLCSQTTLRILDGGPSWITHHSDLQAEGPNVETQLWLPWWSSAHPDMQRLFKLDHLDGVYQARACISLTGFCEDTRGSQYQCGLKMIHSVLFCIVVMFF